MTVSMRFSTHTAGMLILAATAGAAGLGGCGSDSASSKPSSIGNGGAGSTTASGGRGTNTGGVGSVNWQVAGSSSVGTGGSEGCADEQEVADLIPANLFFVVDKSGSMNCNAPPVDTECSSPEKVDTTEPSKWEITQNALTGPNGALSTLAGQDGVSVGLTTFPVDDGCAILDEGEAAVDISSLDADQLASLQTELTSTAQGETPLAGAGIRALEILRQGVVSGELKGNSYLVVMTDGAETCQKSALGTLLAAVETAYLSYGIKTYAIGAPGSEDSRRLLSEMAILGGTRRSASCVLSPESAAESCHIDLTESTDFELDLGAEFEGITESAVTCEFDVPQTALIDLNKVNVELTPSEGEPELIPQDAAPACSEAAGWQYSEDSSKVILCGSYCDNFLNDTGATVKVVFGCRETVVW